MAPPPTSIRSREVCFTDKDWQSFGDALQEMFPQARYVADIPRWLNTPEPPEVVVGRHLCAVPRQHLDNIIMVFDPFWVPSCFKGFYGIKGEPGEEDKWQWSRTPPPHPTVMFRMWNTIWQDPAPNMGKGEIHFYATPKNKEHLSLQGKFYRLFAKHATNKGLHFVSYPDYKAGPEQKGLMWWCGQDAIRWSRSDPRHFLHFQAGSGLRPIDATADVIPFRKPAKQG